MVAVTTRWVDADGGAREGEGARLDLATGAPWRWLDVVDGDDAILHAIAEQFDLHPLLVEDVIHRQHRPKLDVSEEQVFLVWLTPEHPQDDGIVTSEIDAFLGPDYLITMRASADVSVAQAVADTARSVSRGPDWILHAIIDRLVDSVLPIADALGDDLDDIEDALLRAPRSEDLKRLYAVRRRLVQLHRIVAPERDILRGLARERAVVSEDAYRYFQDVGDHLARVEDSIETYRDVAAAAMDIYLSAQSNRMNEIMKQLTVVATIFMPLTLVSGIYGMNVIKGMWPPVLAQWSFAAILVTMLAIAAGMALYFRRKNWW